jgi:hypothetical protein
MSFPMQLADGREPEEGMPLRRRCLTCVRRNSRMLQLAIQMTVKERGLTETRTQRVV